MKRAILYGALVLTLLVGTVYAVTNVTRTNRVFQTMLGGTLVTTDSMTATDQGFELAFQNSPGSGGTTPAGAVTFPAGPAFIFASTPITQADWVYRVSITLNAGAPPDTTFQVKLQLRMFDPNVNGFGLTILSLYVKTPSSITPGAGAVFTFDIGDTLASPLSYTLTVASL